MDSGDHRPEALQTAQRIADEVLFPAAKTVEETGTLPTGQLDLLAEHGFYGLAAPEDLATLDLPDFAAVLRLIEILAGGCLTTAFVWIQHHGLVRAVAASANETVRDTYLGELIAGRLRGGLAIGAALRLGRLPFAPNELTAATSSMELPRGSPVGAWSTCCTPQAETLMT